MVQLIAKYVEYSRILGIYTLAIRIRQYSWWMQELLKNININIKLLKKKTHKLNKNTFFKDISEIKNKSGILAEELRRWMHYLKLVYFHNSTILYLHLKILLRLNSKIKEQKKKMINLKKREKDKLKERILRLKIRRLEREIKYIKKADKDLIDLLKESKRGFNKILRRGFSIKTYTFLTDKRVTKKIKIKARKIKETELKRRNAMSKLNINNERHIKKITRLIEKEIHAVEKDVLYNRQLIRKLENKKNHIEGIIKHFGKKLFRLKIDRKNINNILVQIRQPYRKLNELIVSDEKKMFYNALRQLNMSARKSRKIAA